MSRIKLFISMRAAINIRQLLWISWLLKVYDLDTTNTEFIHSRQHIGKLRKAQLGFSKTNHYEARFQVLMVASMKMSVFWDVVPCSSTRLYGATSQKKSHLPNHMNLSLLKSNCNCHAIHNSARNACKSSSFNVENFILKFIFGIF
jgi:hypothetical protein